MFWDRNAESNPHIQTRCTVSRFRRPLWPRKSIFQTSPMLWNLSYFLHQKLRIEPCLNILWLVRSSCFLWDIRPAKNYYCVCHCYIWWRHYPDLAPHRHLENSVAHSDLQLLGIYLHRCRWLTILGVNDSLDPLYVTVTSLLMPKCRVACKYLTIKKWPEGLFKITSWRLCRVLTPLTIFSCTQAQIRDSCENMKI